MINPYLYISAFMLCALVLVAHQRPAHANDVAKNDVPPIYVTMAPITIPLMRSGYVEGSFHIRLDIAVATKTEEERVTHLTPRLEAAFLGNLSDLAQFYIRPGEQTDVNMIGRILQQTTNQILGTSEARLLISDTAIRR